MVSKNKILTSGHWILIVSFSKIKPAKLGYDYKQVLCIHYLTTCWLNKFFQLRKTNNNSAWEKICLVAVEYHYTVHIYLSWNDWGANVSNITSLELSLSD